MRLDTSPIETDTARSALLIGGASWNQMLYLDALPTGGPQTLFARRSHQTLGSSGAGKALNLAALGWRSTLWSLVGNDDAGDEIRHAVAAAGVELLEVHDPAGSMRHVNLMDPHGDRVSIFVNSGTLDMEVDPDALTERAVAADLVAVTIFEHCRAFLDPLRDAGVPLWVDVHDYDGTNPYHEDFIEAASHLQVSSLALTDWRSLAESRLSSGAVTVVCTHGADGASVLTAQGWTEVAAQPVDAVVDTNGAGDAYFAGFATSWLDHGDPARAAVAGAATAAAAVSSPDLAPAISDVE